MRFRKSPLNLAALAVGLWLVVRVLLAAGLGLSDDEAYYWDWSRHLSWSYFDHPGMTAWLIALSRLCLGDTPLAVRMPGLICHLISWILFARLARKLFGPSALLAQCFFLFAPVFGLGSILMTPDAPMALFWMWTLYLTWDVATKKNHSGWLLGLSVGLGFLSKYTIVLLVPQVLVFLFFEKIRFWRERWFYQALSLALICSLPVVIWNWQQDWPSFRFHLSERQAGGLSLSRELQFWLSQMAFLSPFVFAGTLATIGVALRMREARQRFLFWTSAPLLSFFALQAAMAEFKPHWPAPAYLVPLMGLASLWDEKIKCSLLRTTLAFATWFFLLLPIVVISADALVPLGPKLARTFNLPWKPIWDPLHDLSGWQELGAEIKLLQERLPGRPHLASWRYQLTSQLAFATGQRVWRLSDLKDQYSFLQNPDELTGQSVLFINDDRYQRDPSPLFETCRLLVRLPTQRLGEIAHEFDIWLCDKFKNVE